MKLVQLPQDRRGATAIEYAMIAAMVAIGLIVLLQLMGASINTMLTNLLAGFAGA